jgi:RNA polymerase sigma-70 factor (ECF subfamily)
MLRRLAGDGADDLAQETFLAAWRAAASWRQDGSYRSWLYRIAWRKFLSERRGERPAAPLDAAAGVGVEPSASRRAAIEQAMARLGERERMAALLCFAEGYSHGEAATIMDVPLGTLKSLVARARRGLVECLEDEQ